MDVNELAQECYRIAEKHGWWEREKELMAGTSQDEATVFLAKCALITTEISEAVEAKRTSEPSHYLTGTNKPEGWAVELADAVIRIFNLVTAFGVADFDAVIQQKMEYNRARPYRHGGKLA